MSQFGTGQCHFFTKLDFLIFFGPESAHVPFGTEHTTLPLPFAFGVDLSTLANVVTSFAKMDDNDKQRKSAESNGDTPTTNGAGDSAAKAFGTMAKIIDPDVSLNQVTYSHSTMKPSQFTQII